MGRDKDRLELDSRYCKKLRLMAIEKGYRSPKAYTKSLMDRKENINPKRNKRKNEEFIFW